jgi:phytoene/squalene synthetase
MKALFDQISQEMSELTTKRYSTSFSLGISFLDKEIQKPIYAIYGFVRFADEIVDTFHGYDKEKLLADFKVQTYEAIAAGISLNPILNSFQWAVNRYQISAELIDTFLDSIEMDLQKQTYDQGKYETYILGSAEVVGLMCLRVFCEGNEAQYQELKKPAMQLGSAFQKINFLRDIKNDYLTLGRVYFPNLNIKEFDSSSKKAIEADILSDFNSGLAGIKALPKGARLGVYIAYVYYLNLLKKITQTSPSEILEKRIRVRNSYKYFLIIRSYLQHSFNSI